MSDEASFRLGLRVGDVAEAAGFYERLGFERAGAMDGPDGRPVMAILEVLPGTDGPAAGRPGGPPQPLVHLIHRKASFIPQARALVPVRDLKSRMIDQPVFDEGKRPGAVVG